MPADDTPRFGKDRFRRCSRTGDLVADRIVEFQKGEMRLCDDQVLVVAMIADQREAFRVARQVVAVIAGDVAERDIDGLADQKFRPRCLAAAGFGIAGIELAAAVRPEPVDRIEIECRRAEILDAVRVGDLVADRGHVERDVVIDELPEIGEAGRHNHPLAVGDVAVRAAGIGIAHRVRQLDKRSVLDLERRQIWKHSSEHAGVVVAAQPLPCQRRGGRLTACPAMTGFEIDVVGHAATASPRCERRVRVVRIRGAMSLRGGVRRQAGQRCTGE